MYIRRVACSTGNAYYKYDENLKTLNKQQFIEKLKSDKDFFRKITYWTKNIKGSKQYFKTARGKLFAMISQLGLPTFYITFS